MKNLQFHHACYGGDLETAKALINDPDVNPSDNDNLTIALASSNGHKDIVELLMRDPRVDPSDDDNCAISWAAHDNRKEVVDVLLTDECVMDKIDVALKWCKKNGGHKLLKDCVDEHKRKLKQQEYEEKERRIQEAIEEMSADCELHF